MDQKKDESMSDDPSHASLSMLPSLFEDVTHEDPEAANQPARYVIRLRRVATDFQKNKHDVGVGMQVALDDFGRHIVKELDETCAAHASGMVSVGDILMQVEGNACVGLKPEGVMKLIRYVDCFVFMCVCVMFCMTVRVCVCMYNCRADSHV
jgi:hypothetical protein